MPSSQQNATVYVGTDWLFEVTVTDVDNGGAKDLTGASVEWVMQPNAASTSPTIKIDSVTVTDAANGVLEVSVGNADTTADKVMVGNYDHWVIVTDGTGKREPVTIGRITVLGLPS